MSTMYKCNGACKGVSDQPGTCQAGDCERSGQPLQQVEQCEGCTAATTEDSKPHACEGCSASE